MPTPYKIQSGDSLSAIAQRQKTTLPELLRLNPNIKNPNLIIAGSNLNLPDATSPSTTGTPITGTSPSGSDGGTSPLTSAIGARVEPKTSARDTLLERLTSSISGVQAFDPVKRRQELEAERGVTDLRGQVGSFEQEIAKTQGLLDSLETDIKARTTDFLLPEESRRRVLASEQNPLIKQIGTLERGLSTSSSRLAREEGAVADTIGLEKEAANAPLDLLLKENQLRAQIDELFPDRERLNPVMEVIASGVKDPGAIFQILQENGITDIGSDEIVDTLGKLNQLTLSNEKITSEREGRSLAREKFEQDKKEFGMEYALKAQEAADKKALADAKEKAEKGDQQGLVDVLKDKVDLIGELSNHSGLDSRVGPNAIARRQFSLRDEAGAGQEFAGKLHQLSSKEFIDTLVSAKAAGATFGALNEQEGAALRAAATAINDWEVVDEKGKGIGEWNISETALKKELATIEKLAKRAIEKAGGTLSIQNDDIQQVDELFGGTSGSSFDAKSYF